MISFRIFEANRTRGLGVRRALRPDEISIIGGFVVGQDYEPIVGESTVYAEAAARKPRKKKGDDTAPLFDKSAGLDPSEIELSAVTKTPIIFDENDIKFLSQFPPDKWKEALWWRYGPGLKEYSETQKDVMDVRLAGEARTGVSRTDVSADVSGRAMTFRGIHMYMTERYKQLVEFYGFDFTRWVQTKTGAEATYGDQVQWSSVNYKGPTKGTCNEVLQEWKLWMPTGFLGKIEDAQIVPMEGRAGPKPSKVTIDWDGNILNLRAAGAQMQPAHSKKSAQKTFGKNENVKITYDERGVAFVSYAYYKDDGNVEWTKPAIVPQMLPGMLCDQPMFGEEYKQQLVGSNPALADYSEKMGHELPRPSAEGFADMTFGDPKREGYLRKAVSFLLAEHPNLDKPVITQKELKSLADAGDENAKNVLQIVNWARGFVPGSHGQFATKKITVKEYRAQEQKESRFRKTKGAAQFVPGSGTIRENPMNDERLKSAGLDKFGLTVDKYNALTKAFFISAMSDKEMPDVKPKDVETTTFTPEQRLQLSQFLNLFGSTDLKDWKLPILTPNGQISNAATCQIIDGVSGAVKAAYSSEREIPEEAIQKVNLPELVIDMIRIVQKNNGAQDVSNFIASTLSEIEASGHEVDFRNVGLDTIIPQMQQWLKNSNISAETKALWSDRNKFIKDISSSRFNTVLRYGYTGGAQSNRGEDEEGRVMPAAEKEQVRRSRAERAGGDKDLPYKLSSKGKRGPTAMAQMGGTPDARAYALKNKFVLALNRASQMATSGMGVTAPDKPAPVSTDLKKVGIDLDEFEGQLENMTPEERDSLVHSFKNDQHGMGALKKYWPSIVAYVKNRPNLVNLSAFINAMQAA